MGSGETSSVSQLMHLNKRTAAPAGDRGRYGGKTGAPVADAAKTPPRGVMGGAGEAAGLVPAAVR